MSYRARQHSRSPSCATGCFTALAIALGLAAAYYSLRPLGPRNLGNDAKLEALTLPARMDWGTAKSGASRKAGSSGRRAAAGAGGGGEQARHGAAAADPEEQAWFAKLSAEGCGETEHLRVCSHRAATTEQEDVASGSLTAYATLFRNHIRCFDIDYVATGDGHLLATHPADLQAAVGAKAGIPKANNTAMLAAIKRLSLHQLREAGASQELFPTAGDLFQLFGELLAQAQALWAGGDGAKEGGAHAARRLQLEQQKQQREQQQQQQQQREQQQQQREQQQQQQQQQQQEQQHQPDYATLPVIMMDLKGPAFHVDVVRNASRAAHAARVAAHAALYVLGEAQAAAAAQAGWGGPLIAGFLDQADANLPLTAEAAPWLADAAMLGPSIQMADAFFQAALQLGKPVHAWVVDGPEMLHRALTVKVDSVISNRPLAMQQLLGDWRDRCSERTQ
eukprot:scaffold10.g2442.t1